MFSSYMYSSYVLEYTYVLIALAIFLLRVLYSYTVFINAKRRKLDIPVYWAIMSFIAGTIAFVLYFAVNYKLGEKEKPKKHQIVSLSLAFGLIICMFISAIPLSMYEKIQYIEEYEETVIERVGPLKYVTYDKMGNEYDVLDLCRKDYYSYEDDSWREDVPVYTRDGEKDENSNQYLIDSDGYAVYRLYIGDFEERRYDSYDYCYYVYFDKEHNIYYDSYVCSWDKDGNLVFKDKMYEKLTYENTEDADDYEIE
ncbi:MAG: hypothetical protein ACI4IG_03590 [Eubacterium sp.]